MRDDGANQANLTNNAAPDYQPVWSPDGNRIAFVSDRDGDAEVYTISILGGAVTKVTNNGIADLNPSYSPDSTRLVYQSAGNIVIKNADGTGAETPLSSSGQDSEPAWSPSGSYVVYVSTRDAGNAELYRVTSDGSTTDRLTSTASLETNPGWSPDSAELVYTEESGGVRELRRAYYTGLSIRPIGQRGHRPRLDALIPALIPCPGRSIGHAQPGEPLCRQSNQGPPGCFFKPMLNQIRGQLAYL